MVTKNKLLTLLSNRVFCSTLNARPDRYGEKQRKELRELPRFTEEKRARFHGYYNAERIVAVLREEIRPDVVRPMVFPTSGSRWSALPDIRERFFRLVEAA
jgi:hypothetical protein